MNSEYILADLKPKIVWKLFEDISRVPRESKHEEKIRQWVKNWAKEHNIPYKEDKVGNLLLKGKPTPGKANYPTIVLQSHMDMVCQKTPDSRHDFSKDPIQLKIINDEFVTAEDTTLGADNGIGMAICLACLIDKKLEHGPIEVLLTVDEETGLTGAFNVQPGFFTGKLLLNLDSEDLGEITISSAGGGDTKITLEIMPVVIPDDYIILELNVSGLTGGHSGVDIHLPRLNALKVATDFLMELENPINLISFKGGTAHNAIPRSATCIFALPATDKERVIKSFPNWERSLKAKAKADPNIKVTLEEKDRSVFKDAINSETTKQILKLLFDIPHGPIAFSKEIEGLVETSNNLAIVDISPTSMKIACSTRSAKDNKLEEVRTKIKSLAEKLSATVELGPSYPGWEPDLESKFLQLVKKVYEEVYGQKVKLKAIHAGLETGLFKKVDPEEMQLVSLGPTIKDGHSPKERLYIKDVSIIYNIVQKILSSLNSYKLIN